MGICETRSLNKGTEAQLGSDSIDALRNKVMSAKNEFNIFGEESSNLKAMINAQAAAKKGSRPGEKDDPSFHSFAEHHKKLGKKSHNSHEFKKAIEEYTTAIKYYPYDPIYYFDRALCYKNLKDYHRAVSDCRQALKLNPLHVKANYLIAVCLFQLIQNKNDLNALKEAVSHIETAYVQAKKSDSKTESLQVLQNERRKMKKLYHSFERKEKVATIDNTKKYLESLMALEDKDNATETQNLVKDFQEFVKENNPETAEKEVPDYLIAKISFEMLRDPLLTMDGITYEANDLRQHFEKIGYIDPITRRELDYNRVIPNKTILACVDHYLDQNPWAYEESTPQYGAIVPEGQHIVHDTQMHAEQDYYTN